MMAARGLTSTLLAVCLALSLWVAGPPTALAQADQSGVITGQVTNGTAGGPVPADIEVVIHVLTNRVKTDERRVRTDGAGRFRVEDLATGPEMLYFPIIDYQRAAYFPDRPVLFQTPDPVNVEITIYEATASSENLSFERLNMLVMDVTPTAMTVMEMGAVVNNSDRTLAADPETTGSARTLRFALPPGAIQITGQAGLPTDSLESTPDGFATTDAVKPGRREIAFSYQLPYQSSSVDFGRTFTLPVGTFTVYLPDESIQLVGPGLTTNGTAELGGRTFRQYSIQNVQPGTAVRFRLSGLPAPFFGTARELGFAVAAAASVALMTLLLLSLRRRRSMQAAEQETEELAADAADTSAAITERQALIRAVADLDERFAAGGLDEETYRTRREEQKARLMSLTRAPADV
ncbi:MAG: hypothetical protein AB7K36_10375 [Chloroflexota bacterium]